MTVQRSHSQTRCRARPRRTRCAYPMKALNIARRAPRCSPRRSNCAAISSASPRSAGRCRKAAAVTGDYRFQGEDGPTDFARTVRRQADACRSTATCSGRSASGPVRCAPIFWPRGRATPRTSAQKVSLAVVARSPIERLIAWKEERGWRSLRLYSDLDGAYSRDFFAIAADGTDEPALNVFTRRDGTIRHFWSDEMSGDFRSGSGSARRA